MPTQVTLLIDGFCMCYLKPSGLPGQPDDVWNIQFICDDEHKLSAFGPDGDPISLWRSRNDRFVDFVSDIGPQPPAKFGSNQDKDQILNLADARIHGDGTSHKLKLKRANPTVIERVWMRVPGGVLWAKGPLNDKFYWRTPVKAKPGSPDEEIICIGQKVSAVKVEFEIEGKVILRVKDQNECVIREVSYPTKDSIPLEFRFDNRCQPHAGASNDFPNIYDLIEDEANGRQFNLGKTYDACAEGSLNDLKKIEKAVRSPQSNCDPVIVDPPIGG